MSLRLRKEIQEMLHGQGEVIRLMPKFSEKSLVEDYIYEDKEKELFEYWFLINKKFFI
ncbi:hypothetical protein METP3_00378 [Methanosarcinales archaeon]|nr:hypothetical protein METP3_00378 [Methanosarcinales archaeon]